MRIYVLDDYEEMSMKAASIVASQIILKPDSVIGLATGSTPLGMYRELVKMHKKGILDFSQVITFNLDEYVGIPPEHPQSYHYYMYNNFFNHLNMKKENINIPPGDEKSVHKVCEDYEQRLCSVGRIDLQVTGIGTNGHVGFNEPDQELNVNTHLIDLKEETIEANSRFFSSPEEVPRQAISMGMGSIMKAKKIIMLANGPNKAKPIEGVVKGKISTQLPASLVQLHPDVTLILDGEAANIFDLE